MKTLLLAFLGFSFSASAQQGPTSNTQCQLQVDEILSQQIFDIDDPISEDARYIIFELYDELNSIYIAVQNNDVNALGLLIPEFEETIVNAEQMSLNYTMFDADINYVETINI